MHTIQRTKTLMLTQIDPPLDLLPRIITSITREERHAAQIRAGIFSGTTVLSVIAMVTSFRYAWESFAQSSFSTYASLLSSDGGTLLLYWKEFAFSLIESLPLTGITLLLAAIFILLFSLKLTLRYVSSAYAKPQFTQFA